MSNTVDLSVLKGRVLFILDNPSPFNYAFFCHVASIIGSETTIDFYDAYREFGYLSPLYSRRDRIYERISRKTSRLLKPSLNGKVLSGIIKPCAANVPDLPALIDDLRAYSYRGARVGLGALSTAASLTRLAERTWTSLYGMPLRRAWVAAHYAADAACELDKRDYDHVFIFNGRHAVARPFCDILEKTTNVIRFETGAKADSFILSSDDIHGAENFAVRALSHPCDRDAGERYFTLRKDRAPGTDAHKFTSLQKPGLLPANISEQPVVAFFSSSEDEFFAVSDRAGFGQFETQNSVVLKLNEICAQVGKQLVIRLHPHLRFKPDSWEKNWDLGQLAAAGAIIVYPAEHIDTYALVETAEAVVSCGSSIGIEAAAQGKASAMVGTHIATVLGIVTRLDDAADMLGFLKDPVLPPTAHEGALVYGSYLSTSGEVLTCAGNIESLECASIHGSTVDPVRRVIGRMKSLAKFGFN